MTELNRENPSHNILDDLVARNQNWDKVESHLDKTASQSEIGHILAKVDTNGNIILDINEQTGTSYTLALSDINKFIDCNNADPFTLTVPTNASVAFPVGTQILIRQKGAGQVTIMAADGVTLNANDDKVVTFGQYAVAGLIKVATNTWAVFGNLEAVA